jgi:hypothetical protein
MRPYAHDRIIPSRSSRPKDHDFTMIATRVVDQAIREQRKWIATAGL